MTGMTETKTVPRHLPGLDLLRAGGVLLVVWFHFWQQTWLTPGSAVLARWVRYGFQFVDLLVLLSAVCNFWPYARAIALDEPWPDTKTFYRRRAARILPCYGLSAAAFLALSLADGAYHSGGEVLGDLLSYLTFSTAWRPRWLLGTHINVVLWTVQIELFYYLLLPLLARAFRRRPALTCTALWAVGLGTQQWVLRTCPEQIRLWVNHPLSFAGYYANGMLLCMGYLQWRRFRAAHPRAVRLQWLALPAFAASLAAIDALLKRFGRVPEMQLEQLAQRQWLLLAFTALCAAALCLPDAAARAAQCAPVRFVCAVSYNLYIWHQQLAVRCKEHRLPYWAGDTPPNQLGDTAWQWRYNWLIVGAALAVAVLVTYGFERPLHRYLTKEKRKTAV